MIDIHMSQSPDGTDIAAFWDEDWPVRCSSRHGALMKLARLLASLGMPDQPWRTLRAGRVCMHGPSLHRLADLTVHETLAGPRIARFVPDRRHGART